VVEKFRALPPWARRETAAAMVAFDPVAFGKTPQDQAVTKVSKVAKAALDGVQAKAGTSVTPKVTATAGGAGTQKADNMVVIPTAIVAKAPKGWKRPEVCRLECAKRLGKAPSTLYTRELRQADLSLLSTALGAADRGRKAGSSLAVIVETITSVRESPESFVTLWPSVRARKAAALKNARSLGLTKPDVRSIEGVSIIYTPLHPVVTAECDKALEEDRSVYESKPCPLANCPFHTLIPGEGPELMSKVLIQRFLKSEEADYTHLQPYLHLSKYRRFIIFWVKSSLSGLTWGDGEDREIVSIPSPTPKKKKRKTTHNEMET
jgi:hypothetical protein